jgi:hypothetical protein
VCLSECVYVCVLPFLFLFFLSFFLIKITEFTCKSIQKSYIYIYIDLSALFMRVGDKENHEPVLHWAMPLHMLVLASLLVIPDFITDCIHQYIYANDTNASATNANNDNNDNNDNSNNSNNSDNNDSKITANTSAMTSALLHTAGVVIVGVALSFGTHTHPFLLADNRHLSFYVWKRVLSAFRYRFVNMYILV